MDVLYYVEEFKKIKRADDILDYLQVIGIAKSIHVELKKKAQSYAEAEIAQHGSLKESDRDLIQEQRYKELDEESGKLMSYIFNNYFYNRYDSGLLEEYKMLENIATASDEELEKNN